MVVASVISVCLAVLIGGTGLWTLLRRTGSDVTSQVLRLVAPTQVAAGVMLAAGGVAGLAGTGRVGLIGLIVGAVGAVGTIAAGSWQGARYAARREASAGCGSGQGCGGCNQICG